MTQALDRQVAEELSRELLKLNRNRDEVCDFKIVSAKRIALIQSYFNLVLNQERERCARIAALSACTCIPFIYRQEPRSGHQLNCKGYLAAQAIRKQEA